MKTDRIAMVEQNSLNNKDTVLVTGGLGFIGSHVVEDLLENGFNVVIYDDMSNGRNFNKQAASILLRDITVIDDFSFITQKIKYVVHLAAAISVPESVRLPEKYERINVEGSRQVLDWARHHGVKRLVAASSAACYGVPAPENIPLREEVANGGVAPYSQTKFKMEKLMEVSRKLNACYISHKSHSNTPAPMTCQQLRCDFLTYMDHVKILNRITAE